MVALALDIGDARIGVAVSDRTGTVASPVKVLPAAEVLGLSRSFRAIVADHEPDVLVVGRPRTLAGEDGPQAERVMEAGRDLARALGLPVEFADERLSSAEARRILREQGLTERKMRGKVDMLAASLFLQAWLDSRNGGDERGQA